MMRKMIVQRHQAYKGEVAIKQLYRCRGGKMVDPTCACLRSASPIAPLRTTPPSSCAELPDAEVLEAVAESGFLSGRHRQHNHHIMRSRPKVRRGLPA